jgi:hypothetical protein
VPARHALTVLGEEAGGPFHWVDRCPLKPFALSLVGPRRQGVTPGQRVSFDLGNAGRQSGRLEAGWTLFPNFLLGTVCDKISSQGRSEDEVPKEVLPPPVARRSRPRRHGRHSPRARSHGLIALSAVHAGALSSSALFFRAIS